jgi:hypothetical protein
MVHEAPSDRQSNGCGLVRFDPTEHPAAVVKLDCGHHVGRLDYGSFAEGAMDPYP